MKQKKSDSNLKTRKLRAMKERVAKYKTRLPARTRSIRSPLIPLKPEEWDKYRGETFAFFDEKILAHGLDLDKVLDEVLEKFGKQQHEVSLFKVPMSRRKIL